ncbi:MAG: SURF1 family protein [Nocardioides sp.]|uniref:SURF1 family cytochrome oxidase biogenesis protein n=1 Tax=Nocardioides sp. TaxID=35761 RepID=UPI003F01251B
MGFLFSRRWLVFAVVVAALAYFAWWLGEWQFHRLDDRRERNEIIERNEKAAPVPVEEVLAVGEAPSADEEWRRITATGTYATEDTVIVRYRTRDGAAGVNVVVPLELPSGASLLVDRGWYATSNRGASSVDVPAPPSGEVTVEAWVRRDGTGAATEVSDQSTRAINSENIGPALDREVLGGFVELVAEDPAPAQALTPGDLPELDDGPHFFYGLQWWFFGLLALFGFGYLMYDESRGGRGVRRPRARREAPIPYHQRPTDPTSSDSPSPDSHSAD